MKRWFVASLLVMMMDAPLVAQEVQPAMVRVTMEPEAELFLNHQKVAEGSTHQLTLQPGQPALLKVMKQGYVAAYRVITPSAGERRLEAFTLKRESIPVLFRCEPEAMVLCDGQELGKTPFSYLFDEPKAYRIVFRAAGFDDHAVRLNLDDAQPQVVNATLQADSAILTIESTPAGASVFVNGVPRGVTPCELPRLRQGAHAVELKLQGYHPYKQTVDLKAGEQQEVVASLQKLPAGLTITSVQPQATVYVNGVHYGTAPVSLNDAVEGAYVVRVEKDGYKPIVRSVVLKSGATREERFDLEVQTGTIKVQTQPGSVQIYVDGRRMAQTHPEKANGFTSAETSLELPLGEHTLSFRAEGYADEERTIQVKAYGNETLRLRLNFKPNFEVRTESAVYRGVLVRQDPDGSVALELKPGSYRTFTPSEIRSKRFWSEKNAAATP